MPHLKEAPDKISQGKSAPTRLMSLVAATEKQHLNSPGKQHFEEKIERDMQNKRGGTAHGNEPEYAYRKPITPSPFGADHLSYHGFYPSMRSGRYSGTSHTMHGPKIGIGESSGEVISDVGARQLFDNLTKPEKKADPVEKAATGEKGETYEESTSRNTILSNDKRNVSDENLHRHTEDLQESQLYADSRYPGAYPPPMHSGSAPYHSCVRYHGVPPPYHGYPYYPPYEQYHSYHPQAPSHSINPRKRVADDAVSRNSFPKKKYNISNTDDTPKKMNGKDQSRSHSSEVDMKSSETKHDVEGGSQASYSSKTEQRVISPSSSLEALQTANTKDEKANENSFLVERRSNESTVPKEPPRVKRFPFPPPHQSANTAQGSYPPPMHYPPHYGYTYPHHMYDGPPPNGWAYSYPPGVYPPPPPRYNAHMYPHPPSSHGGAKPTYVHYPPRSSQTMSPSSYSAHSSPPSVKIPANAATPPETKSALAFTALTLLKNEVEEDSEKGNNRSAHKKNQSVAKWQEAALATGKAPSTNRCAPLTGPIPTKYWGEAEKIKDAWIPDYHRLVNYPDYLTKNRSGNASSGDSLASSLTDTNKRNCVMCGKARLSTASAVCTATNRNRRRDSGLDDSKNFEGIDHEAAEEGNLYIIPRQNKGLCTACDVTVWVITDRGLEIKWCKGCKNFRPWAAFGDKGLATKCVRCRDRQREKYAIQKDELKIRRLQQDKGGSATTEKKQDHDAFPEARGLRSLLVAATRESAASKK